MLRWYRGVVDPWYNTLPDNSRGTPAPRVVPAPDTLALKGNAGDGMLGMMNAFIASQQNFQMQMLSMVLDSTHGARRGRKRPGL